MAAKLAIVTVTLLACALADPSYYGYGGYAYGPRAYYRDGAPGFHAGGGVSYTYRSPQGIGKRSADAEPEAEASYYGYGGYAYGPRAYYRDGAPGFHAGGGVSYTARSTQGIGKRSADAEPEAEASYYGYGPAYHHGYYGYPRSTSYEYRSPQGLRGKREAEPSYYGSSFQHVSRALPYGGISTYGVRTGGYHASLFDRRRTPLHKREAEPSYSFQNVNRYFGYGGSSNYAVNNRGYSGVVNERRAAPYNSYGYGFNAY